MGRLSAFILGAAAGGGFPQWNCNCDVWKLAWAGDPRVKPRTQASIAVTTGPNGSADGVAPFVLVNAFPAVVKDGSLLYLQHSATSTVVERDIHQFALGTAGAVAFLLDEVMPASPAYRWTINHTMRLDDPLEPFPTFIVEAGI